MGEESELDKRVLVEQQVQALAHGQLAALVLLGDLFLATHGEVLGPPGAQVGDPGRVVVAHRRNVKTGSPRTHGAASEFVGFSIDRPKGRSAGPTGRGSGTCCAWT